MNKNPPVRKCCLPDCNSTSVKFAVFRFPQNPHHAHTWVSNICEAYGFSRMDMLKNGINPSGCSCVCELHFLRTCFAEKWARKKLVRLRQKPVPTVLKKEDVLLNICLGNVGLPAKDYSWIGGSEIIHSGTIDEKVSITMNDFFRQSFHSYAKPLPLYAVSTGFAPHLQADFGASDDPLADGTTVPSTESHLPIIAPGCISDTTIIKDLDSTSIAICDEIIEESKRTGKEVAAWEGTSYQQQSVNIEDKASDAGDTEDGSVPEDLLDCPTVPAKMAHWKAVVTIDEKCELSCCSNTGRVLGEWLEQWCELHESEYRHCSCPRPFDLFPFPPDRQKRRRWIRGLLGADPSKPIKWCPSKYSRICSLHFIDGEPSEANPFPFAHEAPKKGVVTADEKCSLSGCPNTGRALAEWLDRWCEVHDRETRLCTCPRPFHLFTFPLERQKRRRWIRALMGKDLSKPAKWSPNKFSRICSLHFIDGKPSEANPFPFGKELRKQVLPPSPPVPIPAKKEEIVQTFLMINRESNDLTNLLQHVAELYKTSLLHMSNSHEDLKVTKLVTTLTISIHAESSSGPGPGEPEPVEVTPLITELETSNPLEPDVKSEPGEEAEESPFFTVKLEAPESVEELEDPFDGLSGMCGEGSFVTSEFENGDLYNSHINKPKLSQRSNKASRGKAATGLTRGAKSRAFHRPSKKRPELSDSGVSANATSTDKQPEPFQQVDMISLPGSAEVTGAQELEPFQQVDTTSVTEDVTGAQELEDTQNVQTGILKRIIVSGPDSGIEEKRTKLTSYPGSDNESTDSEKSDNVT